ncbi:hypothetical protein OPS25_08490 [Alteromonas ponticola]|uniref:Bacterial virulence factor lipase N-terminal domain-containing protein n=1 Tax=Alteromonas aquimaris TaxID=2998417 RepID=A0ABT3P6Z1_9ALTE|nr:VolA/Pla-1 family phospholipase [Alteromonas aquimaris]MCW8108532.1 hypothetical protein [Alteromonas aquimaris]
MRKLFISSSVALALGLAGCGGGETIEDIQAETPTVAPSSRVVFDPANGELNTPNDLLMLPGDDGFFDYTLNIPVADPTDFSDPQNALNILDGWSTQHPFVINVNTVEGASLDESTLSAGVHIFEATLGLDQTDPDCAQAEIPSSGCKIGDKLTFGVDYVLSLLDGDTISVVPLRPLKASQGHMLVMTTDLKDSNGNAVQGSTSWDLVRQDINTNPLSSDSQLQLQTLVNSYIDPLLEEGFERENITYVSAFTTQSTDIALQSIKQKMVAEFAARSAAGDPTAGTALPAIVITDATGPTNSMETLNLVDDETLAGAVLLGISELPPESASLEPFVTATDFSSLQTCDGLFTAQAGAFVLATGSTTGIPTVDAGLDTFAAELSAGILAEVGPFCAAQRYEGTVSLPYYLGVPTADNPTAPVTDFWSAACDSGIVLAGAPDEVLAEATPGPNFEMCQQLGLSDLRVNGELLDKDRNITRFNPIPEEKGSDEGNVTLDVQVTVPNVDVANGILASVGMSPIAKPEAGWPVVILVHGITSQKEDMLAISGTLALAGIASVAIDHPLHGSRGYDLDPTQEGDEINATTVSATHYMNLASLPTARDNLRQSVADLLGLRLGLNAVVDMTTGEAADFDLSRVSVMGVSLGAMTGGNFAAVANTTMGDELGALDGMYAVKEASLESPGGGVATFLLESPTFGDLVKGSLLRESSPEFVALLGQLYPETAPADLSDEELVAAVGEFDENATPEQLAEVQSTLSRFAFAAQTVLDAGDPNNYGKMLGENTPVHMMTVIGDGSEENLPDQVIPPTTTLPLSGQNPLAAIIGLEQVSSTVTSESTISGQVKFVKGVHGSSLNPVYPDVTEEMQREVAGYISSDATAIVITNEEVVAN